MADHLTFMKGWAARIASQFGHDLSVWEEIGAGGVRATCKMCGEHVTVYASGAYSGQAVRQYCSKNDD